MQKIINRSVGSGITFIVFFIFLHITTYSLLISRKTAGGEKNYKIKNYESQMSLNKKQNFIDLPSEEESAELDLLDWKYLLVNYDHPITQEFIDSINFADIVSYGRNFQVDKRIATNLKQMIDDAKAEGINLMICSAFRTIAFQSMLFNDQINQYIGKGFSLEAAKKEAASWVAVPATSEHHTGLAIDIVSPKYQDLDNGFCKTDAYAWLIKNCDKYGFILRYPKEKKDITHVNFEPWHFRFVGKETASNIKKSGLCLEEYLEKYGYKPKEQTAVGENTNSLKHKEGSLPLS